MDYMLKPKKWTLGKAWWNQWRKKSKVNKKLSYSIAPREISNSRNVSIDIIKLWWEMLVERVTLNL